MGQEQSAAAPVTDQTDAQASGKSLSDEFSDWAAQSLEKTQFGMMATRGRPIQHMELTDRRRATSLVRKTLVKSSKTDKADGSVNGDENSAMWRIKSLWATTGIVCSWALSFALAIGMVLLAVFGAIMYRYPGSAITRLGAGASGIASAHGTYKAYRHYSGAAKGPDTKGDSKAKQTAAPVAQLPPPKRNASPARTGAPKSASKKKSDESYGTQAFGVVLLLIAVIAVAAAVVFYGAKEKTERTLLQSLSTVATSTAVPVESGSEILLRDVMHVAFEFARDKGVNISWFSAVSMCAMTQHKEIIENALFGAICKKTARVKKQGSGEVGISLSDIEQARSALDFTISKVRSILLLLDDHLATALLQRSIPNDQTKVHIYELDTSIRGREITISLSVDDATCIRVLRLIDFLDRVVTGKAAAHIESCSGKGAIALLFQSTSNDHQASIIGQYFELTDRPAIRAWFEGNRELIDKSKNEMLVSLLRQYRAHTAGLDPTLESKSEALDSYQAHLKQDKYQKMITNGFGQKRRV